jgi:hypothetical protein
MLSFDGYLAHELIRMSTSRAILFVVNRWASREAADAAMSYALASRRQACGGNSSASLVVAPSEPRCDRPALVVALANAKAEGRP